MGWSSRLFLLSADDALHRLASAAFGRMLRPGSRCRVPDFAGQRVRLASAVVELADGIPLGVRHLGYSILDFDVDGILDIPRLNAHQVARIDAMLAGVLEPCACTKLCWRTVSSPTICMALATALAMVR